MYQATDEFLTTSLTLGRWPLTREVSAICKAKGKGRPVAKEDTETGFPWPCPEVKPQGGAFVETVCTSYILLRYI